MIFANYLQINHVPGAGELMVICGAMFGAGLGFLWFNAPPAQIFMGDTGSLALGGLLGAIAIVTKHEIVLAIVGGLFVLEALSVIVQVASFKMTGKRIFRMAPIHHHFEQLGWTEPQVVIRFWIVVGGARARRPREPEAEVTHDARHLHARQAVAIFGLGGSGLATARALAAGGRRRRSCWDDAPRRSRRRAAKASRSRICATRNGGGSPRSCSRPACRSPIRSRIGRSSSPRAAGVEIIGDIELFCRERAKIAPGSPFIAITGTNGKSTTTALIAHILRRAGRDVQMGGNIGTPILALAPPAPTRIHVIECSSFQIDLAPSLAPTLGVLLNITPDHLDRHGTMENYAAIKERLVARAEYALINFADEPSRAIFRKLSGVLRSRSSRRHERFRRAEQWLRAALRARLHARRRLAPGLRPCRHSHLARQAQCRQCARRDPRDERIPADEAARRHDRAGALEPKEPSSKELWPNFGERRFMEAALRSFPGLPHRMEEVGRAGRTLFINDSKATNADSAEKALASFAGDIFWIVGGKAKEGGIESLAPSLPPRREGLSDRRGDARIRGDARLGQGAEAALRHARGRRGARRARCRGFRRAGAGRPALAGLCLLRSVQEFRGARRSLSRARPPHHRRDARRPRRLVSFRQGPLAATSSAGKLRRPLASPMRKFPPTRKARANDDRPVSRTRSRKES